MKRVVQLVALLWLSVSPTGRAHDPDAPPLPDHMKLPPTPIAVGTPGSAYLPGRWDVSPGGQFLYSIPLDVPAGRAGMQPTLSLQYSSGAGDGSIGMGWALSGLSSITRCAKTLASDGVVSGVRYGSSDNFCLDGNKLVAIAGVYGADKTEYRTEHNQFAQIVSTATSPFLGPDSFRVKTKDGRVRSYTAYTANRWHHTQPQLVHHRWLLTRDVDRSGNTINYYYQTIGNVDGGQQILPVRITYTEHRLHPHTYRYVEFTYEDRPDVSFAWQSGVRTNQSKRLTSITMGAPYPTAGKADTLAAWTYILEYVRSRFSGRSLLASVRKCGMKGKEAGACTWKKRFGWAEATAPSFEVSTVDTADVVVDPNSLAEHWPTMQLADVDGDGMDDVLFQPGTIKGLPPSFIYRSRDVAPFGKVDTLGYRTYAFSGAKVSRDLANYAPMDLDGDGKSELYGSYNWYKADCEDEIVSWNGSALATVMKFPVTWDCESPVPANSWSPDKKLSQFFVDFDGDRRLDRMEVDRGVLPSGWGTAKGTLVLPWKVSMNTGGAFTLLSKTQLLAYADPAATNAVDLEGDGRGEIFAFWAEDGYHSEHFFDNPVTYALSEDGNWFYTLESDGFPTAGLTKGAKPTGVIFGDFNGDGLQDEIHRTNFDGNVDAAKIMQLRWNTGRGFGGPVFVNLAAAITIGGNGQVSWNRVKVNAADMNRDGKADLVVFEAAPANRITLMISKGDGTFAAIAIPGGSGLWFDFATMNHFPTTRIGDVTGDGSPDIVRLAPTSDGLHSKIELITTNTSWNDRLLLVFDEPTLWPAQAVAYDWKTTDKDEPDTYVHYPKRHVRRGLVVVRKVSLREHVVDPPSFPTPARELHYSYEGPVSDLHGRGFLGFHKQRIWDPSRPSEKTLIFANNESWYAEAWPYAMRPTRIRTVTALTPIADDPKKPGIDTVDARVTQVDLTNEVRTLDNGKTYVDLPKSWASVEWEEEVSIDWGSIDAAPQNPTSDHMFNIEATTPPIRKRSGKDVFDDFGNNIEHTEETASGASSRIVSIYDNLTENWTIGLVRDQATTAQEQGQAPHTRFWHYDYDEHGRLIGIDREKDNADTSTRRKTSYRLDDFGLITGIATSASGPAAPPARISHIEYEPWWPGQPNERVHPSQVWTEVDSPQYRPSRWVVHHPAYGLEIASMDVNGVIDSTTYDDLGRALTINRAGADPIAFSYAGRPDTLYGINGTIVTMTTGGAVVTSARDPLSREIEASYKRFDGVMVHADTRYDALGRIVWQSRPYTQGTQTKGTAFTYDPLDRLTESSLPDTTKVKHTYAVFNDTTWDAENNKSTAVIDVNGRVVQTISQWNSTPVSTTFKYEAFGLLNRVIDDQGHERVYKHDAIGRTTSAADPDAGTIEVAYNGFDAPVSQHHVGSNETTTVTYDAIGRRIKSVGPDGVTSVTWDTQPNGVGKIATATSPNDVKTLFTYDDSGRSIGFVETVGGQNFAVGVVYDSHGRLQQLRYPSIDGTATPGLILDYAYNAAEYLSEITYSVPGTGPQNLWKTITRNADGALLTAKVGSSLDLVRGYDQHLGRLTNTQYKAGPAAVFDLSYGYHPTGLVKTRNDTVTPRQEVFTYDTVGRLKTWDAVFGSDTRKTNYEYDTEGNLIAVTSTGAAPEMNTYGIGAGPHALTAQKVGALTTDITYDERGRQTAKGSVRTVSKYADFDLPRTLVSEGQNWSLAYDAFGQRARKVGLSSDWIYVGQLYERRVEKGITTHVFHTAGPEGPVADFTRQGSNGPLSPSYVLVDMLGSVSAIADKNGAVTSRQYYEPFGRRIDASGAAVSIASTPVKDGFTGHEHDDPLGLINMRGRVYDPALRRMLTPDPHTTLPLYEQSWNRYSYAFNSPLNVTDPTGLDGEGTPGPPGQGSPPDDHTYTGGPGSGGDCSNCPLPGQGGGSYNNFWEQAAPPQSTPAPPEPVANWTAVPQSSADAYNDPGEVCHPGPTQFALSTDGPPPAPSVGAKWAQARPRATNVASTAAPACTGSGGGGCYIDDVETIFMRHAEDAERGLLGASALAAGIATGLILPEALGAGAAAARAIVASPAVRSVITGPAYLFTGAGGVGGMGATRVPLHDRLSVVYVLIDRTTKEILKWGASSALPRYSAAKLESLNARGIAVAWGTRANMWLLERHLTERFGGPLNRELWRARESLPPVLFPPSQAAEEAWQMMVFIAKQPPL